jgi:hypothetical protein
MTWTMLAVDGFVHVPLAVNTWTFDPAAGDEMRKFFGVAALV